MILTRNACGMEEGAVNDLVDQIDDEARWDAILIQEGPSAETDRYKVIDGGHSLFIGACQGWNRSICILLHKRWEKLEAKLSFKLMGQRLSYLDLILGGLMLRLVSIHMPHGEYSDDEYEAALMSLEEVVEITRRSRRTNLIGMDANAVIGLQRYGDRPNIVGESGMGHRNERGDTLVNWLHGANLAAAVATMMDKSLDETWTHQL